MARYEGEHHSQGQWSRRVTADWQSKSLPEPIGLGSLAAALSAESPEVRHNNGHLPHEVKQISRPIEPTQPFWHRLPVWGLDVIEMLLREDKKI